MKTEPTNLYQSVDFFLALSYNKKMASEELDFSVNRLILGDNLEILKAIPDECIDLIYLDPPFFSNQNYEIIWGDTGEIRSFKDRWAGGINHYIEWLKERVAQMHRVLKQSGSIFLHCDWHADAYIRTFILDPIFGEKNFRNEIIWCYKRPSAPKQKQLSRLHDNIFWYSKEQWKFNAEKIKIPYAQSSLARAGYAANASKMTDGGTVELKEGGKIPEDWWDIPMLKGNSKEWIGYPTQKPEKLLERIILMASSKGDIVLDPFVGGGTTIAVAEKLKRNWIGIDQSVQAIKVTELRLQTIDPLLQSDFIVKLHKYDFETIRNMEAFKFEKWIVRQFGGRANEKQRKDLGIDGKMPDRTPIQVKRQDGVGRPVIDSFVSSAQRYDEELFKKNMFEKNPVGYIIAFSFSKDAIDEVSRLNISKGIIVKLVKVNKIVPIAEKPNVTVNIREVSQDEKGNRELGLTAVVERPEEIEFYSWDFNYDIEKNKFKPSVIRDKKGKQTVILKIGTYNIACKVVDNDGLENIEVIKLKINGGVKWN